MKSKSFLKKHGAKSLVLLPIIAFIFALNYIYNDIAKGMDEERRFKNINYSVPIAICIDECVNKKIKLLHKSESQFLGGASTSSIQSFNQKNSLIEFQSQCEQRLKSMRCYYYPNHYDRYREVYE